MNKNIEMRVEQGEGKIYVSADFLQKLGVPYTSIAGRLKEGSPSWQGSLKTGILYQPLLLKYKQLIAAYYADIEGIKAEDWDIENHLRKDSERQARQIIQAEKQGERVAIGEAVERLRLCEPTLWSQTLGYYGKRDANEKRAEATAKYYFTLLLCERADKNFYQKLGFANKEEFQQGVVDMLKIDKVPNAAGGTQMLRKRLRELAQCSNQEQRWRICLSNQTGNQNASRMKTEENEELLQVLAHKYRIPSHIAHYYNKIVASRFQTGDLAFTKKSKDGIGEPAFISERTVGNYTKKFLPELLQPMYGKAAYDREIKRKSQREAPTKCGQVWVMDGTPIDIVYKGMITKRDPQTGEWKRVEYKWNKLYWVAIIDAANGEIVGSAYGKTETHELVYQAINSALKRYGRKPLQMMYDNSGANKMIEPLIERLTKYQTPCLPHSPQSKPIEAAFGRFKTKYEQFIKGWTGLGIKSKKENSHANPDQLMEDLRDLHTEDELKEIIDQRIKRWNTDSTIYSEDSTWEAPVLKRDRIGDAGIEIGIDEYFDFANVLLKKQYSYQAGGKGLTITRAKRQTNYNIDLEYWKGESLALSHELSRVKGKKYQVRIDFDTPNIVFLYQNDKPVMYKGEEVWLRDEREITGFSQFMGDWSSEDVKKIQRLKQVQKDSDKAGKASVERIKELSKKFEADIQRVDINYHQMNWKNNGKDDINDTETELQKQIYGYKEEDETVAVVVEKPTKTKKTQRVDIDGLE